MCLLHCYFNAFDLFELPCKLEYLRKKYFVRGMKYVSFLFAALVRNIPLHDKYLASYVQFKLETHTVA